jgi:holo-ACP synthase
MIEVTPEELLLSREKRSQKQMDLIDKYGMTVISFTLNIPGAVKSSEQLTKVQKKGMDLLHEVCESNHISIVFEEYIHSKTGDEAYLVVNHSAIDMKKKTSKIEDEHALGRIFDIDIFDAQGKPISRDCIGESKRKCIICDKDTLFCRRTNRHTSDEVLEKYNQIIK